MKASQLAFYIQRCPLENVILKAKKLDLGEPKKILSYALQPPNLGDIERAILNLKEVLSSNALSSNYFQVLYYVEGGMHPFVNCTCIPPVNHYCLLPHS